MAEKINRINYTIKEKLKVIEKIKNDVSKVRIEISFYHGLQNSISAFSPDGGSLIVEAFSWNDPNCWAHNPEV